MTKGAKAGRPRARFVLGLLVVAVVSAMMALPSGAVAASPRVVATNADSTAGSSTVTLNGTIDTTGCGSSVTQWYFQFGSEQQSNYYYDPSNPSNPHPFQGSSPSAWGFAKSETANQAVSTTIPTDNGGPPLTAGVLYYWRVVGHVQNASNPPTPNANCPDGETYSTVQCFKLGQGSVPCPAQVNATFTVVNKRGRPQDAYVHVALAGSNSYNGYPTTPDGKFTTTIQPGEVLRFSRTPDISGNCSAPEGPAFPGYLYTVPDNPPSQVTITLDNTTASDAPETPALSPAERWVVGKINDMRQAKGLGRLVVSTTLDRVAYATAHDAAALKAAKGSYPWPPKYCAAVGDDWGWPQLALGDRGFGGNDSANGSATAALAHWTDASARGKLTFNPDVTDIGVADGGTAWTMFVGDCSDHSSQPSPFPGGPKPAPLPADVAVRCELTSDTGDSSIQLPPDGNGSGSQTGSGSGSQTGSGSGSGTGSGAGTVAPTVHSLLTGLTSGLTRLTGGGLVKAGGATVRFTAASAGRATANCSTFAHRHRLNLMGGASKVHKAGGVTLKLRLTARGRKLLAHLRGHHPPIQASCKATFVPSHGKGITKTTTVALHS